MKSQSNPFATAKPMWKRIKSGEIPRWLIDQLVSVGYRDPRKEYRSLTVFNVISSVITLFCLTLVVAVIYTAMFNSRMLRAGIGDIIAPAVTVCFFIAVGMGYLFMGRILENAVVEKTKPIEEILERLIYSPRPCLTPADLVDEQSLRRAVEAALPNLAARKIVFLGYEKHSHSQRGLSDAAHADLGNLLDAGKMIRILSGREDFTRFFAEASATRVAHVKREFETMLAGLKAGEQPPLRW